MRATCWLRVVTTRSFRVVQRDGSVTSAVVPHLGARQARAQVRGRLVVADHAEELDAAAERGDVVRDVGGAAEAVLLLLEADHRDRRFRRDAIDAADDEVIEHHVADHQDRAPGRRGDERRRVQPAWRTLAAGAAAQLGIRSAA